MKLTLALSTMLLMGACSTKHHHHEVAEPKPVLPQTAMEAVQAPFRSEENKKRDIYRHPTETLKFFGLKSDMTVVEVYPGAGWYTEIIAPLVAAKGKYIMASPSVNPEKPYTIENEHKIKNFMSAHPEVSKNVEYVTFDLPNKSEIAPENSVDMVLTFRNVHNWLALKGEKEAFSSFYKALKPGGVLGVVEHRELPTKNDPKAKSGYVREKDVISMVLKAGFKLVAKSEINANPRDTKNYPEGVWTLPPSLKLGEKDKEKYLAIGESDRMTLKFIKPLK